jgi:ubiquinone biosynthesis monooxygenase Coq6
MTVTLVEGGDLEKLRTWNPPSDKFSNRVVSLTNKTKSFLESRSVYISNVCLSV